MIEFEPKTNLNNDDDEVQQIKLGAWEVFYVERNIQFPDLAIRQGKEFIHRWEKAFPRENTWAQNNFRTPSLIVRMDATIDQNGLGLYEIEERPAGIGIAYQLNSRFREKLDSIKSTWPDFEVLVSEKRTGSDDVLWANITTAPGTKPLIIRAEPKEEEFHKYEHLSLSSLRKKGDKSYGQRLGLWNPVSNPDSLNWQKPFVLKPLQGSKTKEVYIWHPQKLPGSHTRTKIVNALVESQSGMFVQDYIPPVEISLNEQKMWMIYRVYYALNLRTLDWEFLGGMWNARKNLKIHGASDSIFGPVKI